MRRGAPPWASAGTGAPGYGGDVNLLTVRVSARSPPGPDGRAIRDIRLSRSLRSRMNDHQYENQEDNRGNKGHNHTFAHLYSMDGNYACVVGSLGMATCGFIVYMELSPRMGNIWWRDGKVSVDGAIRCMLYPLSEWRMWLPAMWTGNWFVWLGAGVVCALGCAWVEGAKSDGLLTEDIVHPRH